MRTHFLALHSVVLFWDLLLRVQLDFLLGKSQIILLENMLLYQYYSKL